MSDVTVAPPPSKAADEEGYFDVWSRDGTRIRAWRNGGTGVPVIISNGLGTPPAAWPTIIDDRSRFRVATWYYRGTGGGSRPADPNRIRIDDHVDDLLAVMDAEGMERAVLVSWSIGVNVAFEAACRFPDRIAGLLAVAGVPGGTFRAMFGLLALPRPIRRALGVTGARVMRRLGPVLNLARHAVPVNRVSANLISHSGFMLPTAKPEILLPAMSEFRQHDWRWYFDLALAAVDHEPMDLSSLQMPVTMVAGRWDMLTAYKDMLEAARGMPHANVRLLPGSHFLPLEYPDDIHDLLLELTEQAKREAPEQAG